MVENPSAGRFDPPPGADRFEPPRPERRGTWLILALGAAALAVQEYDRWNHPRGVWAAASLVLMLGLAVLQFIARRKLQPDEHQPYSDQRHITR